MEDILGAESRADWINQFGSLRTDVTDGLVILAHSNDLPQAQQKVSPLGALIEEFARRMPVCMICPGQPEVNSAAAEAGMRLQMFSVGPSYGAGQKSAIVQAMRSMEISTPIYIVINPVFIPFCQRAYGTLRLFHVTERVTREIHEKGDDAESALYLNDLILFLERFADCVLVESANQIEWLRETCSYFGDSAELKPNRAENLASDLLLQSAEALRQRSIFPHRLDILVVTDHAPNADERSGTSMLENFSELSRHNIYWMLADERASADGRTTPSTIDFLEYDIVILHRANPGGSWKLSSNAAEAFRKFAGLRVMIVEWKFEGEEDEFMSSAREDLGIHLVLTMSELTDRPGFARELDEYFSVLMPGQPNWQLHEVGKYLSTQAWTYPELLERYGNDETRVTTRLRTQLLSLEKERLQLEEDLQAKRAEKQELDEEIRILRENIEKCRRKGGKTLLGKLWRRICSR